MPLLSRLFIRTSLIYLLAGALLGGTLLWSKGTPPAFNVWVLLAAHIPLMLSGWLVCLTLGVAYWILPRSGSRRPRAWLAVLAYAGINAGLLLIVAQPWSGEGSLGTIGSALLSLGALAFAGHAWPRVKPSVYER